MTLRYHIPTLENYEYQPLVTSILATPPVSPSKGDRYLIDASATGAWLGKDDYITYYDGADWQFVAPLQGMQVWIDDISTVYLYDLGWREFTSAGHAGSGGGGGGGSSPNFSIGAIEFILDGVGSAITAGIAGDIHIPFDCTITSVTLLADQVGSIVIDIYKDTFANFPPNGADSITASAKPTLASTNKYQDNTLTGWTKTILAGEILRFYVDSVSTVTNVTVGLNFLRT